MNGEARRTIADAKRVCFFAHYHHLGMAAGYALYYLDALRAAGFAVVVLSTATMDEAQAAILAQHCDMLIFRENVGLDFGGWMEALRQFPKLKAEFLLLANDSVYAPVTDLGTFISELTRKGADFYGAVESYQIAPHLQSWFLLLRPSAYNSSAFRYFMARRIDPALPKGELIASFEVGLTRALRDAGLVCRAAFSPRMGGPLGRRWPCNPTLLLWRYLLEQRHIPFLKVELMRFDPIAIRTRQDVLPVVEALNPRLAELIREDQVSRPPTSPRGGLVGWLQALPQQQMLGNWREFQRLLASEYEPSRPSWRVLTDHVSFYGLLVIGRTSRLIVRAVRRR